MPRKRHKPEEIVAKLRQVDVLVAQGQSVADAVRVIGVTEVSPTIAGARSSAGSEHGSIAKIDHGRQRGLDLGAKGRRIWLSWRISPAR